MKMPLDIRGEGYLIDAILEEGTQLPPLVQSHLRHILVACELGDLVLVQCRRVADNAMTYLLCAHVLDVGNVSKLLPICELEDTDQLVARMRPPRCMPQNCFVKPTFTGVHVTEVIDDGNIIEMLSTPRTDD